MFLQYSLFLMTCSTILCQRAWDKPVLDRVGLIIEIFNAHAYTKEAKLQVFFMGPIKCIIAFFLLTCTYNKRIEFNLYFIIVSTWSIKFYLVATNCNYKKNLQLVPI